MYVCVIKTNTELQRVIDYTSYSNTIKMAGHNGTSFSFGQLLSQFVVVLGRTQAFPCFSTLQKKIGKDTNASVKKKQLHKIDV